MPNDQLLLLSDGQVCSINMPSGKALRTKAIGDLFRLPWSTGKVVPLYWGCDRIIFFNGAEFQRYDLASGKPDFREPQLILTSFPGLWPLGVDAAFNAGNGKVYFLRKDECVRYDIAIGRADEGYPRCLADEWPGVSAAVDAALCLDGFNVIFFRGNKHTRYSLHKRRVESGPEENRLIEFMALPPGLWRSARALSSEQAHEIITFLERQGELEISTTIAESGGVASSVDHSMRVSGPVGGVRFMGLEDPNSDEVCAAHGRLVVALWRLARWTNASSEGITKILLRRPRAGSDGSDRKHDPSRSINVLGLEAARGRPPFALSVARDWGAKPSAARSAYRLKSEDEPAYSVFMRLYAFATFECVSREPGRDPWPPPRIGQEGLVLHPDYYGTGSASDLETRQAFQDCIHMEV